MIEFYVCASLPWAGAIKIIVMLFYIMYCAIAKMGKIQNTLRKD